MTSLPSLPDDILQSLVCQECFRYLSVPPIVSNNASGDIICGRCFNIETETDVKYKSFYNVIAGWYSFKCINRYDRCSELLSLDEAEEHEKICKAPQQECLFCSFSGVLSQILYHSLKAHPDNVTYDGKLNFLLDNLTFEIKTIFILNDDIFLITVIATDKLLTVEVATITPPLMENQFGVKLFIPDDPLNVNYLHNDYGLLSTNNTNYFEKSKDELIALFGSGVKLCCQLLIGQFSQEREIEYKHKFLKLSHCEEELNNLKQELEIKKQDYSQQTDAWEQKLALKDQLYDSAINVIKDLSWNFKCYCCRQIALAEVYFCPKMHFYCSKCLKNICKGCDSMQEYKTLDIGNFEVSCDWFGCQEILCLKDYMDHKNICIRRPYKCPVTGCSHKVFLSLPVLFDHWHCGSQLIQESSISCEMDESLDCYWAINSNIYHVIMQLNDKMIRVLIEEFDTFPNNVTFYCAGKNTHGPYLNFSNFSGKYDMNIANFNRYYNNIKIFFE